MKLIALLSNVFSVLALAIVPLSSPAPAAAQGKPTSGELLSIEIVGTRPELNRAVAMSTKLSTKIANDEKFFNKLSGPVGPADLEEIKQMVAQTVGVDPKEVKAVAQGTKATSSLPPASAFRLASAEQVADPVNETLAPWYIFYKGFGLKVCIGTGCP